MEGTELVPPGSGDTRALRAGTKDVGAKPARGLKARESEIRGSGGAQ